MKKTMLASLVMLAALALIGLAYARWYENLQIAGTVSTGEVDWTIDRYEILDCYKPPLPINDWTCNPGFTNIRELDKNVAWATGTLVDTDGDGDTDGLQVSFNNVYPSYYNSVTFYPTNNGSIPIRIDAVNIAGHVFRKTPAYVSLDLSGDNVPDVEIKWVDNFGQQLEPGETALGITWLFHVLQGCPESGTFSFTISLDAVQWNEYQAP